MTENIVTTALAGRPGGLLLLRMHGGHTIAGDFGGFAKTKRAIAEPDLVAVLDHGGRADYVRIDDIVTAKVTGV